MTALVVTLAVVVALLVVLVAGLLRSHAEILRTLHDAGLGREGEAATPARRSGVAPATPTSGPSPEASDVSGVTPGGDAVAAGAPGAPAPTRPALLPAGCLPCPAFLGTFAGPPLARPPRAPPGAVT